MSRLNFEAHKYVGFISQRDSIFKLPRNCLSMMDLDPKACMQYVDDWWIGLQWQSFVLCNGGISLLNFKALQSVHGISKRDSIFCTLQWGYQSLIEYEWDLGGWGFCHFGTFLALKKSWMGIRSHRNHRLFRIYFMGGGSISFSMGYASITDPGGLRSDLQIKNLSIC